MTNDLRERMLQAMRKAWAENAKPAGSRIDRQMAEALVEAAIAEIGGERLAGSEDKTMTDKLIEPITRDDERDLTVDHAQAELAARIETLEAENARFRSALKKIERQPDYIIPSPQEIARAALTKENNNE